MPHRTAQQRCLSLLGAALLWVPLPVWALELPAEPATTGANPGEAIPLVLIDTFIDSSTRAKVDVPLGRVTSVEARAGALQVSWAPPAAFAGGPVTLQVRFKDTAGNKREEQVVWNAPATIDLPVVVQADPPISAPGTQNVRLTWTAPPSSQTASTRSWTARTSLGTVGPVTVDANGTASATWTRPSTVSGAEMAIVVVADQHDPRWGGAVQLPVLAERSTTFTVPPDAEVSLVVGEQTFGPTRASPAGTVAFVMHLDPRVASGHLVGKTPHGEKVDQWVQLPVAPAPALVVAPESPSVRAGRHTSLQVGQWTTEALPAVSVVAGDATVSTTAKADGWQAFSLSLPVYAKGTIPASVTAGATKTSTNLHVLPPSRRVALEGLPPSMAPNGAEWTLTAVVVDSLQQPISETPDIQVLGGATIGKPVRKTNRSTFKIKPTRDSERVVLLAEPPGAVTGASVADLVAWWVDLGDGEWLLRLVAEDPNGTPVANASVSVESRGLDGLPTVLTTDSNGFAFVVVKRPATSFGITFRSNGVASGVAMTADGKPLSLGVLDWQSRQTQWATAAPTSIVTKPDATAAPIVAAAPIAPAAAPVTAVSDSPPPPTASTANAAPTASQAPSRTPRSAAAAIRTALSLQGIANTFESTTTAAAIGPLSAQTEGGFDGGAIGVWGLFWPKNGNFGVELDARFRQSKPVPQFSYASDSTSEETPEDTASTPTEFAQNGWDAKVGVRLKHTLTGPLAAYGLAQLHRQSVGLYLWDNGEVALVDTPLLGLRAGGGLLLGAGPLWLDLQAAETFAPYPISLEVDARLQLALSDNLSVHLGGGQAWQSMRFDVDGQELLVSNAATSAGAGIGFRW